MSRLLPRALTIMLMFEYHVACWRLTTHERLLDSCPAPMPSPLFMPPKSHWAREVLYVGARGVVCPFTVRLIGVWVRCAVSVVCGAARGALRAFVFWLLSL